MNRAWSLRGGCARIAWLIGAIAAGSVAGAGNLNLGSYHVGNSLTWDARVSAGLPALAADAGLTLTTGYHIRCGMPLDYIADNPTDVCVAPNGFGTYADAFANNAWDAVTLQPFSGATPRQEYTAAKALIQLARQNPANATTRFYLYANWHSKPPDGTTFYDRWYDPAPTNPDTDLVRNANGFNWIYNELKNDPDLQGVKLLMLPVGDVLAEVDQRMRTGQIPGFNDATELYRDNLHLNNLGRFIASNTFLATLFGLDPTGTPTNSDFDTSPGQTTPIQITPELATLVQDAVWSVVSTHPLALPLPGDLDGDGFVSINDLNLVLGNWNQTTPPGDPTADPTGDGFVGFADLNLILGNWNAGSPPPANTNIPEPASLLIIGMGYLSVYARRARHPRPSTTDRLQPG